MFECHNTENLGGYDYFINKERKKKDQIRAQIRELEKQLFSVMDKMRELSDSEENIPGHDALDDEYDRISDELKELR